MPLASYVSALRRYCFVIIVSVIVAIIGLGVFGVEHVLPRLLIIPRRIAWDRHQQPPEDPAKYGLNFDRFDVWTGDGLLLKGWFVHAMTDKPLGTVLVLHGHSSCKEHMMFMARLLPPHGYNAILYDSRAQGESEGMYCTFGIKEKRDVSRVVDAAQQRYGTIAVGPLCIFGTSFGSAVSIQALAEDKRFSCGIISSSFCDLHEVTRQELAKIIHFDSPWLLQHSLDEGGKLAGFRVADIKPEETAKSVPCPVLVIHGDKDDRFPVDWSRRIYENLPSTQKEWFLARGNNHDDVFWLHDAMNVKRSMLQFLAKHMVDETVRR